jgi:hypothetical protein
MSSFVRPVGVHRDLSELEFISALLQTQQHVLRTSGTIKAADVVLYLKSRHGISVAEETIDRFILTDLAGQTQNNLFTKETTVQPSRKSDADVGVALDICQLTSILLIPELLEGSEGTDFKIVVPFRDAVVAVMKDDSMITEITLRELFEGVGEFNVADEVLHDMLHLARRPEYLIDALVSDIALYKDYQEISCTSKLRTSISNPKPSSQSPEEAKGMVVTASTIHTAPSIDFSSDTFRRPLFGMLLWTAGIAAYFAYVLKADGRSWVQPKCDSDTTACNIAIGIMSWLSVFLQLVCLGLPYIFLGSIGNADFGYGKVVRFLTLVISMVTVFWVTIFTYFYVS